MFDEDRHIYDEVCVRAGRWHLLRVEATAAQHAAEQAAVSQVRPQAAAARAQAGHAARRLLLHLGGQLSTLAAALLRHARAGRAGASPTRGRRSLVHGIRIAHSHSLSDHQLSALSAGLPVPCHSFSPQFLMLLGGQRIALGPHTCLYQRPPLRSCGEGTVAPGSDIPCGGRSSRTQLVDSGEQMHTSPMPQRNHIATAASGKLTSTAPAPHQRHTPLPPAAAIEGLTCRVGCTIRGRFTTSVRIGRARASRWIYRGRRCCSETATSASSSSPPVRAATNPLWEMSSPFGKER